MGLFVSASTSRMMSIVLIDVHETKIPSTCCDRAKSIAAALVDSSVMRATSSSLALLKDPKTGTETPRSSI